jgi:hypothetical protein
MSSQPGTSFSSFSLSATDFKPLDVMKHSLIRAIPFAVLFLWVILVSGFIDYIGLLIFPAGVFGLAYLVTMRLKQPLPVSNPLLYAGSVGIGLGILSGIVLFLAAMVGGFFA